MADQQYLESRSGDEENVDQRHPSVPSRQELTVFTQSLQILDVATVEPSTSYQTQNYESGSRLQALSAIATAWQRHLQKLTPEERQLFETHFKGLKEDTSKYVSELHTASVAQASASRAILISNRLQPLFQTFNLYAPIANTIAQGDPSPSSFILGGITCLLSIPGRFLEFQSKITETFADMAKELKILPFYDRKIYTDDPIVLEALIAVHIDVLEFCREASKFVYKDGRLRSSLKIFGTSLTKSYNDKLGGIVLRFYKDLEHFEKTATSASRRVTENFQRFAVQAHWHNHRQLLDIAGTLSRIDQRSFEESTKVEFVESEKGNEELRRERGELTFQLTSTY